MDINLEKRHYGCLWAKHKNDTHSECEVDHYQQFCRFFFSANFKIRTVYVECLELVLLFALIVPDKLDWSIHIFVERMPVQGLLSHRNNGSWYAIGDRMDAHQILTLVYAWIVCTVHVAAYTIYSASQILISIRLFRSELVALVMIRVA